MLGGVLVRVVVVAVVVVVDMVIGEEEVAEEPEEVEISDSISEFSPGGTGVEAGSGCTKRR